MLGTRSSNWFKFLLPSGDLVSMVSGRVLVTPVGLISLLLPSSPSLLGEGPLTD